MHRENNLEKMCFGATERTGEIRRSSENCCCFGAEHKQNLRKYLLINGSLPQPWSLFSYDYIYIHNIPNLRSKHLICKNQLPKQHHPYIFMTAYPFRGKEMLEPLPAVTRWKVWYTLDVSITNTYLSRHLTFLFISPTWTVSSTLSWTEKRPNWWKNWKNTPTHLVLGGFQPHVLNYWPLRYVWHLLFSINHWFVCCYVLLCVGSFVPSYLPYIV